MIWKQWPVIGLAWVLIAAAALTVVYRLENVYRAETLVLVESQKIPESLVASTVNAELQDRLATISQEILSSTQLRKIIEKFSLYQDLQQRNTQEEIIGRMRSDIKIKLERGWSRNQPGAFRITYTGVNPETTAAVANNISTLFIEENLRSREVQAVGTLEFIENQLQQAKKSLEEQEAKVAEYKQEHNGQLPEQEQSLAARLERLRTQLQGSQDAILRAHQNKQMFESAMEAAEASKLSMASAGMAASLALNPVTGAVTSGGQPRRSDGLKKELESLRVRYTDQYPAVQLIKALLIQAQKEERSEAEEQVPITEAWKRNNSAKPASAVARVSPEMAQLFAREQERITGLKTQLALAAKDLEAREAEHKQILADIYDSQGRIERLPIRQQEMAGLLRDYEFSKENYKNLMNKNFSADIAADMEKRQKAERFTILDTARVPEKPAKPNRPILNAVSAALALGLALLLGCAREWKKNVILGEWELPGNIVVLGRIPDIKVMPPVRPAVTGRPAWKLGHLTSHIALRRG